MVDVFGLVYLATDLTLTTLNADVLKCLVWHYPSYAIYQILRHPILESHQ